MRDRTTKLRVIERKENDMANSLLQSLYAPRFVISGRNAVAHYGLCSFDSNVESLESNKLYDMKLDLDHIIFVPETEDKSEIMTSHSGVRYAPLNKALVDTLENLYDDSILEDIFDTMSNEQLQSFLRYLEKRGKQNVREQYSEFIPEWKTSPTLYSI
jgi:hypothetical protein